MEGNSMKRPKMKFARILSSLLILVLLIGMAPMALAADAEVTLEKVDLSALTGAPLPKSAISSAALTKASDSRFTNEEISYVEAVAEEMLDPVGIIDIDGAAGETKYVFVWLQSLPDALQRVYTRERMNVRGYDKARSDGVRARGELRNRRDVNIT